MSKEVISINLDRDKIKTISEATKIMKMPKSKVVSILLDESMFKLRNFIDGKTRKFYILQYIEGRINEEVLFDVFPSEKAKEIIEGAAIGKRAGKEAIKKLFSL